MQKLIRGVHEFQANVFGTQQELFERLAEGQRPEALFITCSDSRIVPNLLTQTEPGELFILRNAGNIIPPAGAAPSGEAATIEFAVSALGVGDIIVCGHTHCGAMRALVSPDGLEGLDSVKSWLAYAESARQTIAEKYADVSGDQLVNDAVKENVLVQLEHLKTHRCVAAAVADGRLKLHGWVYQIETGDVFAYDQLAGHFTSISKTPGKLLSSDIADVDMI